MRAVVCRRLGTPDDLELADLPEPATAPGRLLVRTAAAGANFVDVLMVAGQYQHKPALPFVPGLESAGTVIAVGDGVAGFAVGDRVMCGHMPGAFAEIVTADPARTWKLPPAMGFEAAAAFRSAYHTAYHAIVQRAGLKAGETLLVHGASGGMGLAAVHIGKLLGATVIATGASDAKLAVVKAEGADHVVNVSGGFREAVKELTGGRGADVVLDPVGGDVFDETLRCTAWHGRITVVGFAAGRAAVAPTNHVLIKGLTIMGVRSGEAGRRDPAVLRESMGRLLGWAAEGRLRPHVSHRFPLERAADALKAIADRAVIGRAVVTMGS